MRASPLTTACLTFPAALLLAADPASPLERSAGRWQDTVEDTWSTAATCTISYYNVCTRLDLSLVRMESRRPVRSRVRRAVRGRWAGHRGQPPVLPERGTGGLRIHRSDARVPGGCQRLPSRDSLGEPAVSPGRSLERVLVGPRRGVPALHRRGVRAAHNVPTRIASDHPATGCGTCYPASRRAHSFLFGSAGAPLCRGRRRRGREFLGKGEVALPSRTPGTRTCASSRSSERRRGVPRWPSRITRARDPRASRPAAPASRRRARSTRTSGERRPLRSAPARCRPTPCATPSGCSRRRLRTPTRRDPVRGDI